MEKYLYRFRSVSNLLKRRELEDSYIHFAAPEKLNDPLEGHREAFWSGDHIVWENLFRHYLLCLLKRGFQYLIDEEGFSEKNFPIHASTLDIPAEIRSNATELLKEFLQNCNIRKHIEILSHGSRKVYAPELRLHLRSVQPLALKLISGLLVKQGALPENYKLTKITNEKLLLTSTNLIEFDRAQLLENSERDSNQYRLAIYSLESADLIRSYKSWSESKSGKWSMLAVSFPDDYVLNLKALYLPKWYAACFMESPHNSSIWGTYGENHRAVCLKFKVNDTGHLGTYSIDLTYKSESSISQKQPFSFTKITYSESTLEIDFFKSISIYPYSKLIKDWFTDENGNLSKSAGHITKDIESWRKNYYEEHQKSINTKLADWSGETEYRISITSLLDMFDLPENRSLNYEFNALDGIIFGINTPAEEKYLLMQVAEALCKRYDRKEFNFYQSYFDTDAAKIKYRPLLVVTS
ncbi:DUF2971 domain-containing protein [Pseudomonas syringae]|uniref:DUF2971 domain-containing protein n=2 Tax=Pseudomonas syringae group TaxID=136849 RepID=UPI00200AFAFF|nr:DUF2971 domain-containing protein [Pseudomonas syringae]MCK9744388.1 DUF2971 domain-containing protein [Pseudomonas syringae pv. syringae]MCK9768105.1 DUF2971 domain-containing protein [Pseudomonas syringae pv. syringae]